MPKAATSRAGWTTVAFGDVVRLSTERSSNPESDGFERFVGLEHIEPGDLRIRRWGDIADGTTFTSVFRPGQVLFGKRRAYQRKVAVADFSGVCSGDIYVLEPRVKDLLPELLPFICQTDAFLDHAVGTSAGSLSPRTNWTSLAAFEFALPPIEEQRRILETLQAAEQSKQLLENALHCSQSVLSSFLEHQLEPNRRGWGKALLGDLFEVRSGGTPSRGEKKYWGGPIPWVKTGEVRYETIHATEEGITEAGLNNSSAKLLPIGTVVVALFGQGPTLGRVGMLGIQAATNQACACIVPNGSQNSRFLYFYLQRQYERIRSLARGANQPNLNLAIIRNLEVPLLGEEEQCEWVGQIEAIESAVSIVQRRLQVQRDLSGQILQSALKGTG